MKKAIKKVLILGSGALKIGQAGEFDYSGSQAIKALREDGVKTIVVNPNIATVQTSRNFGDEVYFLPVTPYFVEQVIKQEKPDGILLSFGGQTGLNCGVELQESGVLAKYGVEVLGTPVESILLTEDREKFAKHLKKLNVATPTSISATTTKQAVKAARKIGYPVMVRAAFALGGQSSGIVTNEEELVALCNEAFSFAPQVLVEQYLHHYKEIEYEVVRDKNDNCITVCNMENFDPLGIHTGESIVVAPSQTLTNHEYHTLRAASIDVIRSLGIVGECNIQYALNPNPKPTKDNPRPVEYKVIEVNARLSRSSALASKATGYPLAYVAAKLALGKTLDQVPNQVTKVTQSFFEPAMDYCVVKMPRWDIEKFRGAHEKIGSSMKSVGEVMGVGRTFEEAVQKAVRMLEIGVDGVTDTSYLKNGEKKLAPVNTVLKDHITRPTPRRLFALSYALSQGKTIEQLHTITGIDTWFLRRLQTIVEKEQNLKSAGGKKKTQLPDKDTLIQLKQTGFSDKRIATLINQDEMAVRTHRIAKGVTPSIFQIDTLAAEFPAQTNYLYTTYHGSHSDIEPLRSKGVAVLGSGPYRIGSSVEFDWACVMATSRLSHYNRKSIIINCNPETVSTDYDMSDRLYFEELTLERVLDIYDFEQSYGVIVSVGGQAPNNIALKLHNQDVPILGTSAVNIDRAEDRNAFSDSLDKLGIKQPQWTSAKTLSQAERFCEKVGYPVLVRPSYVLSGSAMSVCRDEFELERYLLRATHVSKEHPVTISKFFSGAKEIELDAIAERGEIVASAISEHVEFAGVHSGDATIVYPAQRIYVATEHRINDYAAKLAKEYDITGPFNIQFLAFRNHVRIIEMNLRASRTLPLISKASGVDFPGKAVDAFFDSATETVIEYPTKSVVKAPQFSYARLTGADPVQHVEMASTGEVGCFGDDVDEAFLKAMLAVGFTIPKRKILLSIGDVHKEMFAPKIKMLHDLGYEFWATKGTAEFMKERLAIDAQTVNKSYEGGDFTIVDLIEGKHVEFVINLRDTRHEGREGKNVYKKEQYDGFEIRRTAADNNIPLLTNVKNARLFVSSLKTTGIKNLQPKPWSYYVPDINNK